MRQRAAAVLEPKFRAAGIALRNKASTVSDITLQELLSNEVSAHLVSVLRLAMIERARRRRTDSQEAIGALRGIIPDDGGRTGFADELDRFAIDLRKHYPASPALAAKAMAPTTETVDFICRDRLIAAHPAYAPGDWLDKIVGGATLHLRVDSRGGELDRRSRHL